MIAPPLSPPALIPPVLVAIEPVGSVATAVLPIPIPAVGPAATAGPEASIAAAPLAIGDAPLLSLPATTTTAAAGPPFPAGLLIVAGLSLLWTRRRF
jgi:hypothetical protein